MVERLIRVSVDYLKFTLGAMLLATVGFFLYASIRTIGIDHEQFDAVRNTIEIAGLLVVATKILTGFFSSSRERVVELLSGTAGFERLSFLERSILSVASVFLSFDTLMTLLASLLENHSDGVKFNKPR